MKRNKFLLVLCTLIITTNLFAQTASVTWSLASSVNATTVSGNVQATSEQIGVGPSPIMSVFGYNGGQRLWVGNSGWTAGSLDPTRYIQFDVTPNSGNSMTVTNVSFDYGDVPLVADNNILNSQVYYSTDGWANGSGIGGTMIYKNTATQTFSQSLNVYIPVGQSFSIRIYIYAVQNQKAGSPTFAIHSNVKIDGTTKRGSAVDTCSADSINISTGWDYNSSSTYNATVPATNQDVFWTLINAPTNNGPVNLNGPAWVIKKDAAWASPVAGSQWISAFNIAGSNQTNIDSTYPAYIFQKSICVSDTTDLTFDLSVMVDNRVKIKFVDANGNLIDMLGQLNSSSTSNFMAAHPFNHTVTHVIPGTYYIRIELRNDNGGSPMGVNLQGWVKGAHAALINSLCCHPNGSSITGYKFNDVNGNGIKDTGESFLAGWEFTLSGNGVNQTSTTDANGNYLFTGLQPGMYTITETPQLGWVAGPTGSSQTVTIGSNAAINNINFGNKESANICDHLKASASKSSPDQCCWILSLNQPSNLTGINSIQITALAPNQFTTGTGLGANYQSWFTSGSNTFTPSNGIVPGGNLNNFFNMCLNYVTTPQLVVVKWLDNSGGMVCSDTVKLDCEIPCTTILHDTVTCAGNYYNYSYTFKNNAIYAISNIEYTVQSPNSASISPIAATLSAAIQPGATSGTQNIHVTGVAPGDVVTLSAKFIGTDGCCWCYETLNIKIPSCATVCDSLSVTANGSQDDCCYSVSITNNSNMVFSNIEFALLSGGMYSTVETTSAPGWAFNNVYPNNLIKLVKFPTTQGIGHGSFSNILNMCIRQYSSPDQVIEVRWIKDGNVICKDTLKFSCVQTSPPSDSCSQAINGIVKCLPDGTAQFVFRVQNNSNIISTGFGIYPTTPGVSFSKTIFHNVNILPGQVSPLDTITISGSGLSHMVCFQTAIFTTITPGENTYNYCCHSDTMCISIPDCKGHPECVTPPKDMRAWWTFDEAAGNISNDISGYNNAGTQIGSPVSVAAEVMSGLSFNGKNYVQVHDHAEINFGIGDLSFDAWIKTEDNIGRNMLVDKRTNDFNHIFGYSFFLEDGYLSAELADGGFTDYISHVFVADGQWHHIAVTISRHDEKGIKFYIDGTFVDYADPTPRANSLDNKNNLRIAFQSLDERLPFEGILDEIELFNRSLEANEVSAIFNAGSAGKCKPKETSVLDETNQIPKNFELMQCYPNPFNPTTTIQYAIASLGSKNTVRVQLKVYDVLGREVIVLVDEDKAPGIYNVIFNATTLPSGVYFYRMSAGNFSQSRKMILMK